jgi:hypothetical protein
VSPGRGAGRQGSGSAGGIRLSVAAVLLALVAVDLVLVGFAVTRTHAAAAEPAGPIPTFGVPPTGTPTPAPTPTASPVAAAPRVLAAVSATEAWRATPGSCQGGGAEVDHSTDGGATWQAVSPPVAQGAGQVLALTGASGANVSAVVASGAACTPDVFITQSSGQFWKEQAPSLAGSTFLEPGAAGSVHTSSGDAASPCAGPVQALDTGDGTVAVLCAAGVSERADGQSAWVSSPVQGGLAIAATDHGYVLAASGASGCAGLAIESLPSPLGSAAPTPVGCIQQLADPSAVTLSAAGSSVWLWSGGTTMVSTDGGATWG